MRAEYERLEAIKNLAINEDDPNSPALVKKVANELRVPVWTARHLINSWHQKKVKEVK